MSYTVYMHVNRKNGKKYIGATGQQPPERRLNCPGCYRESTRFYAAIKKYGWDTFDHVILRRRLTKCEASKLERSYIAMFKSDNPKHGYNIQNGGFYSYTAEAVRQKLVKPVQQYSLDGRYLATYESVVQAAEETGVNIGTISNCARGKTKNPKAFIWRFVDDEKSEQ